MPEWWRDAVFYEVYVRSFADSNGDGFGDLPGIRQRLPYLQDLGIDAIWLTPFYPSPGIDHGYDVADYVDVDPLFGTLADFDELLAATHELGMRLIVDIVPNHTSSAHPWFAGDRSRYVTAPGGNGLPNNWPSNWGGPAWTLDETRGEYYLHLFAPEQPDLDWHNEQVHADFEAILRFWLDRGVDGFRIDFAHGLVKDASLADEPEPFPVTHFSSDWRTAIDQPEVHEIYRVSRPTFARTSSTLRSTSHSSSSRGTRRRSARRSTSPSRCFRSSRGCSRITTSPASQRASASARRARPRCSCWRCPARSSSTRAKSSGSRKSTCPTSCARTRSSRLPAASGKGATGAACRFRGRASYRRGRGYRCRRRGASAAWRRSSRSESPCCRSIGARSSNGRAAASPGARALPARSSSSGTSSSARST